MHTRLCWWPENVSVTDQHTAPAGTLRLLAGTRHRLVCRSTHPGVVRPAAFNEAPEPRFPPVGATQLGAIGLMLGHGMRRGWTSSPSVKPRLRHAEHARRHRDREGGLVRAHELEDPDGIVPASRANQAAARERISRVLSAAACSRGAAERVHHARRQPIRAPSPPGDPPADPPARPSGRSIARWVRTRGRGQPDRDRRSCL